MVCTGLKRAKWMIDEEGLCKRHGLEVHLVYEAKTHILGEEKQVEQLIKMTLTIRESVSPYIE